jgi:uncharacterized membrane protein YqhA
MRPPRDSALAWAIGRARLLVVVAVIAVLLASFSLFLLGALLAATTMLESWQSALALQLQPAELTLRFLHIVTVMMKAVFFYLIGVGLYSLFISPLNVTVALGIETLNDLETKIVSVIIVILGVDFLERFIERHEALEVLQDAGALALAVSALVLFKIFTNKEGQETRARRDQEDAQARMFAEQEERDVPPDSRASPPR